MRPSTSFVVHVADLLHQPGRARPVRIVAAADWGVDMARIVAEPPLDADLELAATSGGVMVRGVVTAVASLTCTRCLQDFEASVRVEISQLVRDESDDDDEYHTVGEDIDLEPILRDEVLLATPLLPRCEPECKGLVRDSETGLNTTSPGSPDSPFAALQDLFDPGDGF